MSTPVPSSSVAIAEFIRRHSRSGSVDAGDDPSRDEALVRNRILRRQYGPLPSYAMFRACDIERNDELFRLEWWKEFGVDVDGDATVGLERLCRFLED